jgi:hypothetical protein
MSMKDKLKRGAALYTVPKKRVLVEYMENNSGGYWWLGPEEYRALHDAGWALRRYDWETETDYILTREQIKADGFLGRVCSDATKVFGSEEEGILEWSTLTGQDPDERGCDCCGQPHYFSSQDVED